MQLAIAALTLAAIALVVITREVVLVLRQRTTLVSPPAVITPSAAPGQKTSAIYSTTIYDYAVPILGVVVDQHLRVVAVAPVSAAEQAGLQPGDIIMRVDGATISSSTAGKQLIQQAHAGQQIMLTVERSGQTLVLPVQLTVPRSQPGQATPTPIPSGFDSF